MATRIREGDVVQFVRDAFAAEPEWLEGVVADVLAVQLRITYETQRPDGGWAEHSAFVFMRDEHHTWRTT